MDWYHPTLGLVGASQPFTLGDVQYPADWLRLATPDERTALGFIPVQTEARPDDKLFFVSEQTVRVEGDVAIVRWAATPRDPADINRAIAAEQITALERSITDRMWREDAIGSLVVMDFGPDDHRTGKTATDYIAFVDAAVAVLRASL